MKYSVLIIVSLGLTSFLSVANSSPPTCEEEPTERHCIKVEDPNATPPKQIVEQERKQVKPNQKPKPKPKLQPKPRTMPSR